MTGYTKISMLFSQALNWPFVVNNQEASLQIFAWMAPVCASAMNISESQVMNDALVVYVPTSYTGPEDQDQLGTIWQGYIPTDNVSTLATLIKEKDSSFYTAAGQPFVQLAAQVNPSFELDSVPGSSGSSGSSSPGSAATSSSSSSTNNAREDAIIGVVSSLGAIALIVLAYFVVRAIKQRRELAHHRLSDPGVGSQFVGARPDGQEFDRDSLGGQRRRSFYYAADSLRGFADAADAATQVGEAMRERRAVAPEMISAPVLRDNTMSW